MATYYAIAAGGNWGAGGTWSTTATKDASRTGGATAPTASDDCIVDDYSGLVVVNATNCVCKTLTCTGNTAGMTFTAAQRLTASGSVTFDDTMGSNLTGTGELRFGATATLTMDGLTFPGSVSINGSITLTLGGTLTVTGWLTFMLGGSLSGAYSVTCANASFGPGTTSLVAGQTLTITSLLSAIPGLYIGGYTRPALVSATPSSKTYLAYTGAASSISVFGAAFTDVDFSTYSTPVTNLGNWYGGTLTRCTGITNRTSADFATAAQAAKILDDTTISGITGTIATRTLSAANDTVAEGYYAATTLSAVDADLAAANIVSGTTIFGVVGSASGGGGGIWMPRARTVGV